MQGYVRTIKNGDMGNFLCEIIDFAIAYGTMYGIFTYIYLTFMVHVGKYNHQTIDPTGRKIYVYIMLSRWI